MTAPSPAKRLQVQRVVGQILAAVGASNAGGRFAVRGALCFTLWPGGLHRSTKRIDLADLEGGPDLVAALRACLTLAGPVASLEWDGAAISDRGTGWGRHVSIVLSARTPSGRIPLQIAVAALQVPLAFRERCAVRACGRGWVPATVPCLSRDWMIAEKLALLVTYSADHTRIQDIADLWILLQNADVEGERLVAAISHCFAGRDAGRMLARDDGYWEAAFSSARVTREDRAAWQRLLEDEPRPEFPDFATALSAVGEFALPLLRSIRDGTATPALWRAGTGWARTWFDRDSARQLNFDLNPPEPRRNSRLPHQLRRHR